MTRHAISTTDLKHLQRQLSGWRQEQSSRTRLPEAVWSAATDLARTHGPILVARRLRSDYYKLRQRLARHASLLTGPPTFVEVPGGADIWGRPGRVIGRVVRWHGSPDDVAGAQRPGHAGGLGPELLEAPAMIQITPQMRILVAVETVDFRNNSACLIIPSSSGKDSGIAALRTVWFSWLGIIRDPGGSSGAGPSGESVALFP